MSSPDALLTYVHIGDLHVTHENKRNFEDFKAIVSEIAHEMRDAIDFVYVPGDNADNGLAEQYALVKRELARLPQPVHIVTGDHDMEQGSLDAFYSSLDVPRLPKSIEVARIRCLFLDICGPGTGGPDFRLGAAQHAWLRRELMEAAAREQRCVVFMHTYPADLKGERETELLNDALASRGVLLVDMGHTHYNELANDGRTIFAATRSTGQIEEGPVGYSIVTIDGRAVSWRFKPLEEAFPVVLITAPADRRLATDAADPDHVPMRETQCEVRASVLGSRPTTRCMCKIDDQPAMAMTVIEPGRYALAITLPSGARRIAVHATNDAGQTGSETIEIAMGHHLDRKRHADGSDADAVDAWPERGIFGTQLGPNRNGKKW